MKHTRCALVCALFATVIAISCGGAATAQPPTVFHGPGGEYRVLGKIHGSDDVSPDSITLFFFQWDSSTARVVTLASGRLHGSRKFVLEGVPSTEQVQVRAHAAQHMPVDSYALPTLPDWCYPDTAMVWLGERMSDYPHDSVLCLPVLPRETRYHWEEIRDALLTLPGIDSIATAHGLEAHNFTYVVYTSHDALRDNIGSLAATPGIRLFRRPLGGIRRDDTTTEVARDSVCEIIRMIHQRCPGLRVTQFRRFTGGKAGIRLTSVSGADELEGNLRCLDGWFWGRLAPEPISWPGETAGEIGDPE